MKRTPIRRTRPQEPREGSERPKGPNQAPKAGTGERPERESRQLAKWAVKFHSVEFVQFVKALRCVSCGRSPCETSHDPSVGAGGKWTDTSPLCSQCHRGYPEPGPNGSLHGLNTSAPAFWKRVGTTPAESNARTHQLWLNHTGGTDG